jgi:acyl-coenzyme A synthetase/AMP-(fatty) acid ligase
MPEAIARWSATTPEAPALLSGEHGDAPVSYAELARRAALLAGKLREAGFARGDLVAIAAEPRVPAAIAMFAAMNVGAALPLLPSLDATELRGLRPARPCGLCCIRLKLRRRASGVRGECANPHGG